MNNRLNPDSSASDTESENARQPSNSAEGSGREREEAASDAPETGENAQNNPNIINR